MRPGVQYGTVYVDAALVPAEQVEFYAWLQAGAVEPYQAAILRLAPGVEIRHRDPADPDALAAWVETAKAGLDMLLTWSADPHPAASRPVIEAMEGR